MLLETWPKMKEGDVHPLHIPLLIPRLSFTTGDTDSLVDTQTIVPATIGMNQFPPVALGLEDIRHLEAARARCPEDQLAALPRMARLGSHVQRANNFGLNGP